MRSILLNETPSAPATVLERVPLGLPNREFDEKWLQGLLFSHPELIPMLEIIPGTVGFAPVCRELSLPKAGGLVFLDILGVTAEGRLVLIECKLWRNPQARREVMAQIMEYAGILRTWSYADLTARLKSALGWTGTNPLHAHAANYFPAIEEASFVDRVSESLRTGDFALVVAGDGIRSDVHAITEQINDRGGLTARMALVEFQLWTDGAGHTLVVPALALRTEVLRQRIVVTADGLPVALQEIGDTNEVLASDTPAAPGGPLRDEQRAFWQSAIDAISFDHPDQPAARHGGHGWIRITLPPPIDSMTAYRTRNGEGGVQVALRGEEGKLAFDKIESERANIESALAQGARFTVTDSTPFSGTFSVLFAGNANDSDAFRPWLARQTNTLVNTLRPLLSSMPEASLV
jgi:hypothetical protein